MTENYIAKILSNEFASYFTDSLEEIRIRKNKPVIFSYPDNEIITKKIFYKKDIIDLTERFTNSSLYAYYDDIANGFITVFGGHRIGFCGTAVYKGEKLESLNDISGLNIRIAKEIRGIGESVYSKIVLNNKIANTLIISPPGAGKTTLLRDLTRLISDNIENINVSLIDERNEISATYMGNSQNDVGLRTDVFCGYKKYDGIIRSLRSMAPDVIVADEIGSKEDIKAIKKCFYSGVSVIATAHANDLTDVSENLKELFGDNIFEYIVTLLSPITKILSFPSQLLPLAIIKMFSSSASLKSTLAR